MPPARTAPGLLKVTLPNRVQARLAVSKTRLMLRSDAGFEPIRPRTKYAAAGRTVIVARKAIAVPIAAVRPKPATRSCDTSVSDKSAIAVVIEARTQAGPISTTDDAMASR